MKRMPKWKMFLFIALFFLAYGIVGKLEQEPDTTTAQARIDEKTAIRDRLKANYELQDRIARAYYEQQGRTK